MNDERVTALETKFESFETGQNRILEILEGNGKAGLKTDVALIKQHCQTHDDRHKGLEWRVAVKTLFLLGTGSGVVALMIWISGIIVKANAG